jgi:hypothetical protein
LDRHEIPSKETFLRRVFKAHSHAKKTFHKLVELGCDRNMLRDWMFQISMTFGMLRSRGIGNRRHLALWDFQVPLTKHELKKLCDRLEWAAVTIEDLRETQLAKYMRMMPLLSEGLLDQTKRMYFLQAQQFDKLPGMLIQYADLLRKAYVYLAKYYAPKKYDVVVAMEADGLDKVKDCTDKFHFEELGVLLEASCDTLTSPNSDIRKRFSGEAIRRRYRRFRLRHPKK